MYFDNIEALRKFLVNPSFKVSKREQKAIEESARRIEDDKKGLHVFPDK